MAGQRTLKKIVLQYYTDGPSIAIDATNRGKQGSMQVYCIHYEFRCMAEKQFEVIPGNQTQWDVVFVELLTDIAKVWLKIHREPDTQETRDAFVALCLRRRPLNLFEPFRWEKYYIA